MPAIKYFLQSFTHLFSILVDFRGKRNTQRASTDGRHVQQLERRIETPNNAAMHIAQPLGCNEPPADFKRAKRPLHEKLSQPSIN